jgi:hypothetical protein
MFIKFAQAMRIRKTPMLMKKFTSTADPFGSISFSMLDVR